ncbi:hypothetical protein [uncultured Aquimarina sp.]|uniref:hypothetical protein n=1 Tax=uncultured Aquimarina sp. TaxID=575652 RepID=UPI002610CF9F|nr:hypothetical protein [uncultured Aquimarina sp.]
MKSKTHRKSPRLADKLKKAVQHLHVDVFGYESKVTQNITNYFSELSEETGIPRDRLILRIFKDVVNFRVGVYQEGRFVKRSAVWKLTALFIGTASSNLFDLEEKVVHKIDAFLKQLATTHQTDDEQLQICIGFHQDKVQVRAYQGIQYLDDIPLRVLIKHFTQ